MAREERERGHWLGFFTSTAREVPGKPGTSDSGGNGVNIGSSTLHSWWDHLPDSAVGTSADTYATKLFQGYQQMTAPQKAAFLNQAKDVNPIDWTTEGRTEITTVGYPSDHKVPDYRQSAVAVANRRILLAGARLANLLNQLLPRS
jgi:hypothetical protein